MPQHPTRINLTATLALLVSILCWSVVPLFLKYFTKHIDGWTANGYRYPFAALLYIPWLFIFFRKGNLTPDVWKQALLPASINLVGQSLWAWAPYFINPALQAFIVRLSVVWAVMGSFILFSDEQQLLKSKRFWSGILLAITGFLGIVLGGSKLPADSTLTGIIIIILCSVFWALYNLAVRRNMNSIDSRLAFGVISLYTAIGCLILMFILGTPSAIFHLPARVNFYLFLSAFIGIATAHVLFYVAMKRIGVAISTSVNLASPFITAILSYMIFNEILTGVQWGAGVLLASGAILLLWAQEKLKAI
ncbi:DMT family transporter [candidate division KSB1 bacterium]|nr:DMT family transporter [candidate division KSB1 bacterium]